MNPGEGQAAGRGPISGPAFDALTLLMSVVLVPIETSIVSWAVHALGYHIDGSWGGAMVVPNMLLSRAALDRILRRVGLSRSGTTREARGRWDAPQGGVVADCEAVEIRLPRSLARGMGVACLLFCLVVSLIVVMQPQELQEDVGYAYAILGFFGLGAVYCFCPALWDRPLARADASGILGVPLGPHVRRRFVPWSEVETCEIETAYDTSGERAGVRPILKGRDGETLLAPDLRMATLEDQDRLASYVSLMLPRVVQPPGFEAPTPCE